TTGSKACAKESKKSAVSLRLTPLPGKAQEYPLPFRSGKNDRAAEGASLLSHASERLQVFSRDAKHCPFAHRRRSQFPVKINRRLIPIQHRPFQPPAIAFFGKSRDVKKQRSPETAPAMRFVDEKILDVDSWTAEERRIVVKKKRKADGLSGQIADGDFCRSR